MKVILEQAMICMLLYLDVVIFKMLPFHFISEFPTCFLSSCFGSSARWRMWSRCSNRYQSVLSLLAHLSVYNGFCQRFFIRRGSIHESVQFTAFDMFSGTTSINTVSIPAHNQYLVNWLQWILWKPISFPHFIRVKRLLERVRNGSVFTTHWWLMYFKSSYRIGSWFQKICFPQLSSWFQYQAI